MSVTGESQPSQAGEVRPFGFEWRTRAQILGIPLVHVALGYDARGKLRVARGIVAIGQFAYGVLTIAQFGVGIVTVAQFGAGIATVAQLGVGVWLVAHLTVGRLVQVVQSFMS